MESSGVAASIGIRLRVEMKRSIKKNRILAIKQTDKLIKLKQTHAHCKFVVYSLVLLPQPANALAHPFRALRYSRHYKGFCENTVA